MAAAPRLLREGAVALEPLDPDGEQHLVLVHQRGGEPRIGLAPLQRHPVDAVLGEQIEPFVEPVLVDQPRLADDEIDQLLVGRRGHCRAHIDIVMYFDQARNWLRICHSVVPLVIGRDVGALRPDRRAADIDPLVGVDLQALLRALVDLEIVVADHRGRRVDQPVVHQRALEQHVRRVDQAERPGFHQRLVGGDRLEQPDELDRPFDHQVREIDGVVPVLVEDRLGALLAIGRDHLVEIAGHRRIVGVDRMAARRYGRGRSARPGCPCSRRNRRAP